MVLTGVWLRNTLRHKVYIEIYPEPEHFLRYICVKAPVNPLGSFDFDLVRDVDSAVRLSKNISILRVKTS